MPFDSKARASVRFSVTTADGACLGCLRFISGRLGVVFPDGSVSISGINDCIDWVLLRPLDIAGRVAAFGMGIAKLSV